MIREGEFGTLGMSRQEGVATRSGEGRIEKSVVSSGQEAVEPESEITKKLFRAAMESKWEKLVKIYEENGFAPIAINRGGGTILHLVISIGKQDGVIELMKRMEEAGCLRKILETENEMGDVPMHHAAFLGMDKVCLFMANRYPEQAQQARNRQGETPLHVAVLYGQKKAFFALQAVIDAKCPQLGKDATRNRGGDTVLHAAISREHFDLAWEIIHMDPNLKDSMNIKGESALHILATKPSAFRSGTDLSIIETLIYYSLPWSQLQLEYSTYKKGIGRDDEIGIKVSKVKEGGDQADQDGTVKQRHSKYHNLFSNIFTWILEVAVLFFFGLPPRDWKITEIKKKFNKVQEKKRKNSYAYEIMKKLVTESIVWMFDINGRKPEKSIRPGMGPGMDGLQKFVASEPEASPLLMAAKRGVLEMVEKILERSPASVLEVDSHGKNIILLAAEYGRTDIYQYMLEKETAITKEALFGRVDEHGNSALHLAASLIEKRSNDNSGEATFIEKRTWNIPGEALQMQADFKWYKYIERSMQPNFFMHYNFKGETAQEIFTSNHSDMIKEAKKWVTSTSASCSVIAALIAPLAYTSANTVPGSFNQETGLLMFKGHTAFLVFDISSLIAFGSSVTALVYLLSIITSRFHESDFEDKIPRRLIVGLTALFWSIVTYVISFCAGHFYTIHDKLKFGVYILYPCVALPLIMVTFTSLSHLFMDLVRGTFCRQPKLSGKPYF